MKNTPKLLISETYDINESWITCCDKENADNWKDTSMESVKQSIICITSVLNVLLQSSIGFLIRYCGVSLNLTSTCV